MKELSPLEKIFSITNEDNHKIFRFFGLKLRCKRGEKKYIFEHLFCNYLYKFGKIKKNKIVFINGSNWQYACNPKYVAEELLHRNIKDIDMVWVTTNRTDSNILPKTFRLVDYNSLQVLFELMSAKIWFMNAHQFLLLKKGLKKPKNTLLLQTWHGSMGIKRESADAKTNAYQNQGWLPWQKLSSSLFDYIFVGSEFEKNILTSAFWQNGEVLKLGTARDSIFYKEKTDIIKKIKNYYNISTENKILLYAPTWRADKRCCCYNIDIKLLERSLQKRFGGQWSILIRPHYLMPKAIFNALYDENKIINVTDYPDMQELLVASDVLISDYSSCIPEYTILKKPSFIYATDMEEYENGFYYPLSTLPSPIATDNGELAQNILNFDNDKFVSGCDEFLTKMGHKDDENSCKRIVDFILEKMGE